MQGACAEQRNILGSLSVLCIMFCRLKCGSKYKSETFIWTQCNGTNLEVKLHCIAILLALEVCSTAVHFVSHSSLSWSMACTDNGEKIPTWFWDNCSPELHHHCHNDHHHHRLLLGTAFIVCLNYSPFIGEGFEDSESVAAFYLIATQTIWRV